MGATPQGSQGIADLKDNVEYLLGANVLLTATGQQYNVADGVAVATETQNIEKDLYTFALNKLPAGIIRYIEFGLTVALLQVTGAVNGTIRWYIQQNGAGAWTKIYELAGIALPAAYSEASGTCLGKFQPSPAITYPINVKLTLTTDGAANMGKAKVNANSFLRVLLV